MRSVLVVFFGSKKRSLIHKFKGYFALSIARNLPVGLQFTPGTRILFRPDVLCAMTSHPVGHVFSEATVEQIRENFVRSPRKSTRCASRETGIPNVTVWRVLPKRLHLKAYALSIVQHLTDADKVVRKEFCMQMFHRIQDDEKFLDSVISGDESTFHVSGCHCHVTAGSGSAKIHVSPWNMFVIAQRPI
ncbi:uncharacterized protein LOC111867343 [Cryptotermes secundus]|uniref:uncharacterized protein LOC111867343 n=1 Tax=Cryptotermes secundus TaxID=105785 RepID=UPI001454CAFE|nr:uncharacterized protein LOC111867343 [Cryptotermes secundus]